MTTLSTTLTAKEIRSLNIKENDLLGFDFEWVNNVDTHYLTVNGQRVVAFLNSKDRRKSFDKIKRMGLGLGFQAPLITDEENGIIQASLNGENPFAYTIICANPERNEIVK